MKLNYTIKTNNSTINQILQNELKISSKLLHKLITKNKITLNNNPCDTRNTAKTGDILTINFNYEENTTNITPTKMNLKIIYEDNWLLIVNKPSGTATHPSILHQTNTLSNGIKHHFNNIKLNKKIRPVNRLDLNTTGLIIFAKCEYIQECLITQMKEKNFKKEYLAICNGIIKEKSGTINLPIARKENSIIERCISKNGQTAITHYRVLKEYNNYSLIKCSLETGRTHQIRIHLSAIGHPLIGDSLYGTISDYIDRQALHCFKLSFLHPITKKIMDFEGELPLDFKNLLLYHQ